MPLPLIIAAAALAAGAYGVKKGVDAKGDFDEAKELYEEAQEVYDNAERSLEKRRENVQKKLERLGSQKMALYKNALLPFVNTFSKIKNVDFRGVNLPDDVLENIPEELLEMREVSVQMNEVVVGGAGALGSGALAGLAAYGSVGLLGTASTGTAIAGLSGAAATNATLAWLGGGALAAGGLGIAGGTIVLGGIVAAPVLAVGGLILASKAEKAKEEAQSNLLKAEAAAEAMGTAEVAARAIGRKAAQVRKVLHRLQNDYFDDDLAKLQALVSTNDDYRAYEPTQKQLVCRAASLAVTAKNIAETPLLNKNGVVTDAIRQALAKAKRFLKQLDAM